MKIRNKPGKTKLNLLKPALSGYRGPITAVL